MQTPAWQVSGFVQAELSVHVVPLTLFAFAGQVPVRESQVDWR